MPLARLFCIASVMSLCFATTSAAETILTVSGDIKGSPTPSQWSFSAEDLRELPQESFQTNTIWTEGQQTFVGVSLHSLMQHVGASEGMLRATALNDYAVSIPTTDAIPSGPIVAYLRNGEEMSLRDKGPLWIVYPFESNPTYNTEEYYSRSIWQLNRIEVVSE
ncbi:oxidoreductase [Shimia sp. R10_1]|uniref:oxidoreductase n=1 Tax=Shimia sp. R10_1 TaxID=2821095 RepID=UPI0032AF9946